MPGEVARGDHHVCLAVDDLDELPRLFCRDPFGNLLELCRMP